MYITISNKRLNIISLNADGNVLGLEIENDYPMQETFDLFKNNDISTISIFDDEDKVTEIHIGYTKIDGFYFIPSSNIYTVMLTKFELNSLKDDIDKLRKELNDSKTNDLVNQQACAIAMFANTLDDAQAYSVRLLFDEWAKDYPYLVNDRVMFENRFYKCLKEHTSNDTLKPNLANYLWVEIANPMVEYPEWKQPVGYADAYKKGDKVTFNGKKYESLIDGNTYSPEVYPAGWKLVE